MMIKKVDISFGGSPRGQNSRILGDFEIQAALLIVRTHSPTKLAYRWQPYEIRYL